jgi:hypothetical protein
MARDEVGMCRNQASAVAAWKAVIARWVIGMPRRSRRGFISAWISSTKGDWGTEVLDVERAPQAYDAGRRLGNVSRQRFADFR